jgi:hypothetical protein
VRSGVPPPAAAVFCAPPDSGAGLLCPTQSSSQAAPLCYLLVTPVWYTDSEVPTLPCWSQRGPATIAGAPQRFGSRRHDTLGEAFRLLSAPLLCGTRFPLAPPGHRRRTELQSQRLESVRSERRLPSHLARPGCPTPPAGSPASADGAPRYACPLTRQPLSARLRSGRCQRPRAGSGRRCCTGPACVPSTDPRDRLGPPNWDRTHHRHPRPR